MSQLKLLEHEREDDMVYKRVAVCLVSLSVADVTDMEGLPKSQSEEFPLMPAGRIVLLRVLRKIRAGQ